jgi:putative heme-binding domain-containing protein
MLAALQNEVTDLKQAHMDRYKRARRLLVAIALVPTAAASLAGQYSGGPYAQADIHYGSRVYAAQCVVCHGATGDTVAGVDLRSGRFRRAASDPELLEIITSGIPGTAMPKFTFNAAELIGLVAYLRNMGTFNAGNVVLGDPMRGQAVFETRGRCATCHRLNGKGPRLAPDLSNIGAIRTADSLQKSILDPTGSLQPVNRSVRAVTRDGRVVTGRRLNEDTYTVQLIDQQERLVSLVKADLREYTVIKTSSMPASKDTLSQAEVADVVAYLLSLKGLQ